MKFVTTVVKRITGGGGTGKLVLGPDYGSDSGNDGITLTATGVLDLDQVNPRVPLAAVATVALNQVNPSASLAATALLDLDQVNPKSITLTAASLLAGTQVNPGSISLSAASLLDLDQVNPRTALAAATALHATVTGAPFYQTVATLGGSGLSYTSNNPSGTQVGDFLLLIVSSITNATSGIPSPVAPAGWSVLRPNEGFTGTSVVIVKGYFYRFATGAAADNNPTGLLLVGSPVDYITEIHRMSGVDTATPLNVAAFAGLAATALVTNPVSPTVTTTVTNCLVVAHLAHFHAALTNSHTPPAGHVERTDLEQGTLILSSTTDTRVFAAAAATGTVTHVCTETVATEAAMTRLAIAPAALVIG